MRNLWTTLKIAGVCIAFYIGAGFATMQEVLQYEASYGSLFGIAILVAGVTYIYTNISFAHNGSSNEFKRGKGIYQIYCGKYIGGFYDWFSAIFCYMCFIVMIGGANSTAMEQWGMKNGVGAVLMTILVLITVLIGFDGVLKALGNIGPIIILFILVISGITAINGIPSYQNGLYTIDSHVHTIVQVGNGNPLAAGASYGGFVILWFATFISEMSSKNKKKTVDVGILLSAAAIFLVSTVCCFALISHIDDLWNASVPALILAKSISPLLALVFALIIFAGIYTSAVPLLWTGVKKVSFGKERNYKIATVAGGIIGCVVACFVPYKGLINVLYGLNGYLGFVLIAFMLVTDLGLKKLFTRERNK